ncbi:MAG: tRNA (adenosine(37)-N6)-threonylcarbamoyltransferase complex dimerization subunit type 1 TsaB [Candidatus Brocadiia bacterium]
MIALGIETSGRTGSLAVGNESTILSSYAFPEGKRRARDLVPAVDRVLCDAAVAKADVDAVAVSQGPGSFTGLRIGVACAKTLAYALDWLCAGVPTLEVKVQNVDPDEWGCRVACPVQDARRGKVYGTLFRWDGGWRDTTGVLCLPAAELAAQMPDGALVFGSGITANPEAFGATRLRIGPDELATARAEEVVRLGLARLRAGRHVEPMQLMPRYHRLTSPEEKLQTRSRAGQ